MSVWSNDNTSTCTVEISDRMWVVRDGVGRRRRARWVQRRRTGGCVRATAGWPRVRPPSSPHPSSWTRTWAAPRARPSWLDSRRTRLWSRRRWRPSASRRSERAPRAPAPWRESPRSSRQTKAPVPQASLTLPRICPCTRQCTSARILRKNRHRTARTVNLHLYEAGTTEVMCASCRSVYHLERVYWANCLYTFCTVTAQENSSPNV